MFFFKGFGNAINLFHLCLLFLGISYFSSLVPYDSILIAFEVNSLQDNIEGYFSADVYDAQGYLIDYVEYTFIINSSESVYAEFGDLGFVLEEGDGDPGYYYLAIYLCMGTEYDPAMFQDYAETDWEWLEVYNGT